MYGSSLLLGTTVPTMWMLVLVVGIGPIAAGVLGTFTMAVVVLAALLIRRRRVLADGPMEAAR